MGLSWNDKDKQWEWEGSVRNLVAAVGNGDARLGFVLDKKSGAKISMNIDDDFGGRATEPFYVLASDGENMYDAWDRREAAQMLTNARDDMKHLDTDEVYRVPKKRKKGRAKNTTQVSVKGLRR
jgi:hypothetical protein